MNLLTQYIVALGMTSVVLFILAVFVYIRNPKNKVNWTFALYSLSIALWSGCEAYSIAAPTEELGLLFWRLNHAAVIFIPVFFIHFVSNLLDQEKENKRIIITGYLIGMIFLILDATPLLIASVIPKFSFKHMVVPGHFYLLFCLLWMLGITFGLVKLFKAYVRSAGSKRNQLKYLCWTSLVGYLGGPLNFLPAFNIELFPFMPFGTYGVPLYGLVITYAIVRYRLVDINIALRRIGIFVTVYALVLGIPFGVMIWARQFIERLGYYGILLPLLLGMSLASGGPFIYFFLQSRTEFRLLAEKRRRQDKLRDLSSYMMRFTRIKTLVASIVHTVLKTLQLKHAAFYLVEQDPNKPKQFNNLSYYAVPKINGLPKSISFSSILVSALSTQKIAIEYGEVKHKVASMSNHNLSSLENELLKFQANIVIPIFLRSDLIGFLILGESRNNETFTKEEINVLQVLSNQAALAIENASFWQGEEDKIVEASREQAVSDVSFGAGHQFNNRLYAISMTCDGIFEMLGERNVCDLSDTEAKQILQKSLPKLKKISIECQYGGEITKGIMSQTGTTPPNFEAFDPSLIINSSLELVEMKHSQDKIEGKRPAVEISCQIDKNLPLVFGSDAQIRDCLFNLVDNSFDAVYEKIDKIRVKNPELKWPENSPYVPHIELKAFIKDNYLIVNVTDNGIGIKEEDKRKIFAGYYSSKPTGLQGYGKGGHGVGLFVVKKFILAHKGKIDFASEYGQGTTFTIELPLSNHKENKNNA